MPVHLGYDPFYMNIHSSHTSTRIETPTGPLEIRQVFGIGRNYAAHAHEQGLDAPDHPMVFTKNIASVCTHGDNIVIPPIAQDERFGGNQTDFEAELAVIIGEDCKYVRREDAMSKVLGFTCANDVSARWWQKKGSGGQFCRGKGFDTFCPLGPHVVTPAQLAQSGHDVNDLRVVCRVNGQVMQDASTSQMMFPIDVLIEELSKGTTLAKGTVILTGTPAGVGMARTPPVWLTDGDVVEIEIAGIGLLSNRVRLG